MKLEIKYKLPNKQNTNTFFTSHSCFIWVVGIVGNFKNFKKHLRLDLKKILRKIQVESRKFFIYKNSV